MSSARAKQSAAAYSALSVKVLAENTQHAPQRLRGSPKQLIADGERAKIFRPHFQLVKPAYRHLQCPGDRCRREATQRRFLVVGNDLHPIVRAADDLLQLRKGHVLLQLDAQPLAMTPHRA